MGCSQFLAIMNMPLVDFTERFLHECIFISCVTFYSTDVEHMVSTCLICKKLSYSFPEWLHCFMLTPVTYG